MEQRIEYGPSTSATTPNYIKVEVKSEPEEYPVEEEFFYQQTNEDGISRMLKREEIEETILAVTESSDIEIKEEPLSCSNCNTVITEADALCSNCNKKQSCQQLINIEELPLSLEYTIFNTTRTFIELLKYIEDDISDIPDCPKSDQLLSVLTKLCSNNDICFINKYRFPSVYVEIVVILAKRLNFLGETALKSDPTPTFLKSALKEYQKKIVILQIVTFKVKVPHKSQYKVLVAYTATGKAFFVSPIYPYNTSFQAIIEKSLIMRMFQNKNVRLVYKRREKFVSCTVKEFNTKCKNIQADEAISHFDTILKQLDMFSILKSSLPSFVVFETGGSTFLRQIVCACCCLLNYKLCTEK